MLHRQPTVFGIDLGFQTIKIVQLIRRGKSYEVWGRTEVPLPAHSITKNGIVHDQEIVSALKTYLAASTPHPITGTRVYAALPESLTFTKTIILPLKNPKEIRQSVNLQAGDILPVAPEEIYIDFIITKQNQTSSEVLLVAQYKKLVDSFIAIIEQAGFLLMRIENKQASLSRLLLPSNNLENIIIVDIGADISKVSLFEYNDLITTATVAIGAQAIQAGQTIELLIETIRRLIEFRASQTKRPELVHKIKTTGVGAQINGLTESLKVALGIPTEIAWPAVGIQGFEHTFAVATGLALAQFL